MQLIGRWSVHLRNDCESSRAYLGEMLAEKKIREPRKENNVGRWKDLDKNVKNVEQRV